MQGGALPHGGDVNEPEDRRVSRSRTVARPWRLSLTLMAKSFPLARLFSLSRLRPVRGERVGARGFAVTQERRNLLTDIAGIRVGHAEDARLASGVSVILFDEPVVAAADLRGGGPGTRETALLDLARTVERIDAIALSGGSAFGLDAASGAQAHLRGIGRGYAVGSARVPIVPGAILFDLLNGGDKEWGRYPPYRELGLTAAERAGAEFQLGSAGAGLGATTVNFKGGVGSASALTAGGFTVAALAVVNAAGSVVVGDGPWFWAAPYEQNGEFGGRGFPPALPPGALEPRTKGAPRMNTTLAVVATDAALTKPQAQRLAVMAQDGLARAIHPVHSPLDGDIVFAAATGARPLGEPVFALTALGNEAAHVVARAIARGVYEATALDLPGAVPGYRDRFR
jgi:D-aminopeptidase